MSFDMKSNKIKSLENLPNQTLLTQGQPQTTFLLNEGVNRGKQTNNEQPSHLRVTITFSFLNFFIQQLQHLEFSGLAVQTTKFDVGANLPPC